MYNNEETRALYHHHLVGYDSLLSKMGMYVESLNKVRVLFCLPQIQA